MTVRVEVLRGEALGDALDALAALRIAVFRAFPYLYDGSEAYEAQYLAEFARSPEAVIVGAFANDTIVGAATASPMAEQSSEFRAAIEEAGIDTDRLYYFGESVLLPAYRGRGIGHAFFDERESAARAAGAPAAMFAAVIRGDDHPGRPENYRPLDAFWRGRGYAPEPGLLTRLSWRELGEARESAKPMQCWMRHL